MNPPSKRTTFPIVVAIIAVLVAIAVPLFVGALNDADKRVIEANERAVRGAAVEEILTKDEYHKDASGTEAKSWFITAYVDAGGNISQLNITPSGAAVDSDNLNCTKEADGRYKVEGNIKMLTSSKLGS